MFAVFVLLIGAVLAAPDRTILSSPGLLNAEFKRFSVAQGRHYRPGELRYRLRVFRDNLKEIIECNEHQSYTCGENQFTDKTVSEKQAFTGLQNMTENNYAQSGFLKATNAMPASKDWRNLKAVTAVKDQGQCGSCWSFSAIGSIEGAFAIATKRLRSFSEQELLDCTYETMYPGYNGCNGGWYYDAYNYVTEKARLALESDFPYEAKDQVCNMAGVPSALGKARLTHYVKVEAGDDYLAGAIAITPVSVALLSRGNFYNYKSGIYTGEGDCQCNWIANHALTAVAYAPDHFVIKNSWGKTWGDHGYIKLARGLKYTVCRVADTAYYPVFVGDGEEPTAAPTDKLPTTQVAPTSDDGCPSGTTLCPDGTCKHIHMC